MRCSALVFAVLLLLSCGDPVGSSPEEGRGTVKHNRLREERSPYLRQHSTNPVDWYPWGGEALQKAKEDDKPIFLSVGYAACHWCHVMEHESFEDEKTAKLLNDAFVCVKVDREERPDIDRIYMTAVQVLTGRGGWPMTVLMFPDGRPFWGGTYLRPENLQGLIAEVKRLWQNERTRLEHTADALSERVRDMSDGLDLPEPDGSDADLLTHMRNALSARFDAQNGGYGNAPKFPPHTEMLFYLDPENASDEELAQARRTLEAMEEGGVHDHVGGGFHRYSTDARWLLPHFEKMLYDNALLAQAYAGMYARTDDARFARVAHRLFDWLEREMRQEGGGYASSLDADTEGEEGTTYTWTMKELQDVLGEKDAAFAAGLFGFTAEGNFMDEATHQATGRNIVHLPTSVREAAAAHGTDPAALGKRIDSMFAKMIEARAKRAQPGLDDKVITAWNGLLISGFARAARDLDDDRYRARGEDLARFLLAHCRREDGTLLRFPRGSGPEIVGFCEDYVHVIEGLLDLAEVSEADKAHWQAAAAELGRRLLAEFQDEEGGGFWTTSPTSHESLIARAKESWDSPIPSDNGAAARLCLRLYEHTGDEAYRKAADRTLAAFRPMMGQPRMAGGLVALFRALALRLRMERAGTTGAARGDVSVRQDVARVDVFLQRTEAKLGSQVPLVVRVALDEGWHVNTLAPADEALIATVLTVAEGSPATLGGVTVPDGGAERYEGTFDLVTAVVVPANVPTGPRKIPLRLTLQPCDAASCKAPIEVRLDVALRFADEDGAARHPAMFGDSKR